MTKQPNPGRQQQWRSNLHFSVRSRRCLGRSWAAAPPSPPPSTPKSRSPSARRKRGREAGIGLRGLHHDRVEFAALRLHTRRLLARRRRAAPDRTDQPNEAVRAGHVVSGAEAVIRVIVEIALKPSVELRQLANEALSKSPIPDPLLAFSELCRCDLDALVQGPQ